MEALGELETELEGETEELGEAELEGDSEGEELELGERELEAEALGDTEAEALEPTG